MQPNYCQPVLNLITGFVSGSFLHRQVFGPGDCDLIEFAVIYCLSPQSPNVLHRHHSILTICWGRLAMHHLRFHGTPADVGQNVTFVG